MTRKFIICVFGVHSETMICKTLSLCALAAMKRFTQMGLSARTERQTSRQEREASNWVGVGPKPSNLIDWNRCSRYATALTTTAAGTTTRT